MAAAIALPRHQFPALIRIEVRDPARRVGAEARLVVLINETEVVHELEAGAFSRDGTMIVGEGEGGKATVWNAQSGDRYRTSTRRALSVSTAPSHRMAAESSRPTMMDWSGSGIRDGLARIR